MKVRGKRGGGEAHLPFSASSSESVLWILRTRSTDTPYPFRRYSVSTAVDTLCGLAPLQPCTVAASEQKKPRATPSNSEQLAATCSNGQPISPSIRWASVARIQFFRTAFSTLFPQRSAPQHRHASK